MRLITELDHGGLGSNPKKGELILFSTSTDKGLKHNLVPPEDCV